MAHGTKLFEVRRLSDGVWETRLAWKYWKASVEEALEIRSFSLDEDFKQFPAAPISSALRVPSALPLTAPRNHAKNTHSPVP